MAKKETKEVITEEKEVVVKETIGAEAYTELLKEKKETEKEVEVHHEKEKISLGCSVFEYITRSPEDLAHYLCEIIGSDENYEETVLWLKSEAKI